MRTPAFSFRVFCVFIYRSQWLAIREPKDKLSAYRNAATSWL
jgi:hypothetical protein